MEKVYYNIGVKTLSSFLIRNVLVVAVCVCGALGLHYYVVFSESPATTSLFPAHYFQDMDRSNTSLVYATGHIMTEIQFAPYAERYTRSTLATITIFLLAFSIGYPTYFWIRYRRKLGLRQKIFLFPASLGLFLISVFLLVLFPKYALTPVLKHAMQRLETQVVKADGAEAVTDPKKIIVLLQKNETPVHIISGYGMYNLALHDLVRNPHQHELSYYEALFLPTAAYALMINEEGQEKTNADREALYYYPETHQLVINEVLEQDEFLEGLSVDLIRDSGYVSLNKTLLAKGMPREYRIVDGTRFAQFYIQKTIENDEKSIRTDQAIYAENLAVLAECADIQKSNSKLVAEQTTDYQRECVDSIQYSNCGEIKERLEDNKRIASEATLSCQNKARLIAGYNQGIEEAVVVARKRITEASTEGTLERNKSESSDGVFMKPSMIYLKGTGFIHSTLVTSVHEFLHFSVDSSTRDLPTFIDEGMTDYLARSSFGYTKYQTVALSGYYAEVQILFSLLEKIPFQEMLDVYISGSESRFKKLFETYFPGVSYAEFIQMGTKTYNTTYAFESQARTFNFSSTQREYVWLEDVKSVRSFLGLEPYVSYTDLEPAF